MQDNLSKPWLLKVWLLCFAGFFFIFFINFFVLLNAVQKQEDLSVKSALALERNGSLEKDLKLADEDLSYLNRLLELYPENKGYLRTQAAITAEVKELRAKVAAKIGGKLHIAIDSRANKLYLKRGQKLLFEADCSVGKGGTLKDKKTGRVWEFATPRGEFTVLIKIDQPAWIKPDWAFVENHEPIPPKDDPIRKVEGELGLFALDIGNGYLIHGTKNEAALGNSVSHGCVRLGSEPLEKLYKAVPVGAKVYIY